MLQPHQRGSVVGGFKALRRAVQMALLMVVAGGMSVTIAFQQKLTPSVVVGSSINLSVATKQDFQESKGVIMRHKLTTLQPGSPSSQKARRCVLQLQRRGSVVGGFKALRRAVQMALLMVVAGGMSVTIAFQQKLPHSIHYPI